MLIVGYRLDSHLRLVYFDLIHYLNSTSIVLAMVYLVSFILLMKAKAKLTIGSYVTQRCREDVQ